MTAQLKIEQAGRSEGTVGKSRTDGLDTGAEVTLTNTGSGATTKFQLLWVPPGDTTAVASLAATEDPKVWTFTPSENVYGSYRIELIENEGLLTEKRERRIFAIRTPNYGIVIPAFNERGSPNASLLAATEDIIEAAENNAEDYDDATLNDVPYAAWWRSMHELATAVDGISLGNVSEGVMTIAYEGSIAIEGGDVEITVPAESTGSRTITLDTGSGGKYAMIRAKIFQFTQTVQHEFSSYDFESTPNEVVNLRLGVTGTNGVDPAIGFLGATLVGRQSITGSTTQEQVDSLVSALVALGLVSDDRP